VPNVYLDDQFYNQNIAHNIS